MMSRSGVNARRNIGGASKKYKFGVRSSFNDLAKIGATRKSGRISTAC